MLFTMGYAHVHIPSMADTRTELARGSCASGGSVWRVMTVRPNGITRNNENGPGFRGDFVGIVPHDLHLPPGR